MPEVSLHLGDCLEVMRAMPDDSAAAVITSPPYNIGKDYGTASDQRGDYLEWLAEIFAEVRRIAPAFWINVGYRKLDSGNIPIAFQIWDRVGMYLVQSIRWEYGAGMTYRRRFNHRSEDWLWFVRDGQSYTFNPDAVRDIGLTVHRNDKRNNPSGKLPGDVWYFPHVSGNHGERCRHPAQFPAAMIRRIVLASTNPGDTVFDPFMGSGTTGEACIKAGRNFIGIEIAPEYHAIAERRIAAARTESPLFA